MLGCGFIVHCRSSAGSTQKTTEGALKRVPRRGLALLPRVSRSPCTEVWRVSIDELLPAAQEGEGLDAELLDLAEDFVKVAKDGARERVCTGLSRERRWSASLIETLGIRAADFVPP